MIAAKCCASMDMADTMIHGMSELEVGEKVIYPVVSDAQDCEKDVSSGYQHKNSRHLKQDAMQCKAQVTNTLRIKFSS